MTATSGVGWLARARERLAWLAFFLPRHAVETLAAPLHLSKLRDRLPGRLGDRLRMQFYPARVTDPKRVACARGHAAWGEPAALDPTVLLHWPDPPRVSILVITHGNLPLTRLCLASVQRAAGATPFEVVVVDNASPDDTPAYLRACEGLPLRIQLNPDNRGFAAAVNQAAGLARGEILVILNNDTVVTPGWLERLVAHLDRDPSVGLVGPVTNSCGNEAEVACDYRDLDAMAAFAADYTRAHGGEVHEPDLATLFCAAIPASLFRAVGGLDERYRIGMFEDDDLTLEIRARGRRVILARDVFVHHYGGAAFAEMPRSRYLKVWWQNRRRFEEKWGQAWRPR